MTTEEIDKAAKSANPYKVSESVGNCLSFNNGFKAGAEFMGKIWQEKTRWKSLETEPPTEYRYNKMYLLRTESGSPYLVPLPYKESVKEFLDNGFIDWKEIE